MPAAKPGLLPLTPSSKIMAVLVLDRNTGKTKATLFPVMFNTCIKMNQFYQIFNHAIGPHSWYSQHLKKEEIFPSFIPQ